MAGLRILNVAVGGYGPFRRSFEQRFHDDVNCLVGPNGCGKSTVLELIAGVCGTDEANLLIANKKVDYCEVVVDCDDVEHVFSITDSFDEDALIEFKTRLSSRVSFPLTQYVDHFISECCEMATVKKRFRRYCQVAKAEPKFLYAPHRRTAFFTGGDGLESAFSLFLHDSPPGTPLLLDGPERHQHIISQRQLIEALTTSDRQLFYSTHSPEMLCDTDKVIEIGGK